MTNINPLNEGQTVTEVSPKPKRAYVRRKPLPEAADHSAPARKTSIVPEVTGYESEVKFYATRYKQGGRTVYALDLSLAQIASLLPAPDPERPQPGNRRIQPAHAQAFANYVRTHEDWVSPAIVLRGPKRFSFDIREQIEGAEFGIVSIPRLAVMDLHILDGQHRILGIHWAILGMIQDLDKARSQLARARKVGENEQVVQHYQSVISDLTVQRKRFETERTSIQVFVEDESRAYQQMFYDIADNALGITASVKARFDTRKIVNRVLTDVMMHPLLIGKIDMERDRLGRVNDNLLTAKHVVDIIRILTVGQDGRITRRLESELHENALASRTNEFFDAITEAFHQLTELKSGDITAAELRQHSLLASPVTLRVLAGTFFELRRKGMSHETITEFFAMLDPFLSTAATEYFSEQLPIGILPPGALGPSAKRQDAAAFKDELVAWADDEPDWLTAA